jgi:single-strand DNA-binding protein
MNKATLHGYVGRDPELKMTQGGVAFARFSFATTEVWKDKEGNKQSKTEWHQIVAWGPLAERAEKNIKKGQELLIEGKIEYQQVPDKDNPEKKVTFTNIKMSNFDFCGKKDGNSGNSRPDPDPGRDANYSGHDNSGDDDYTPPASSSSSSYDDDIPF